MERFDFKKFRCERSWFELQGALGRRRVPNQSALNLMYDSSL